MTFHSGLPLSDAERQACECQRRRVTARGVKRRKACPDKHHYARKPTAADKAKDQRIMGERD